MRVFRYGVWEDFDAGEVTNVVDPPFWGLNSTPEELTDISDVIFIVTLMENDNGDPNGYRQLVEAAASASLGATVGERDRTVRASRLLQSIRDALNGIDLPIPFALDDDHIGTEILRLDNSDLIPCGTRDKSLTIQSSEGHYELTFRIASIHMWRPWFMIHPETVFNQITPVAAVARRQDHLDLFKVGFDGAVWSSWWHDDAEGWRPWFQIHPQTVFAQEAPVTTLARRSDHVDLFITGFDGAVWSSWWHDDGGGWRPWFQIHPQTVFRQDRPVVAVARMPEHVDLFRVGFDGAVWSSWWHGEGDPGGWRPWFQIHPETRFPVEARVSALARRPDHVDLFVVGHDGAVWSSWWHADAEGWRPWFQIHPETVFRHDQEIVVVSREPEHIDLFTVGHDGAVWSSWWHADAEGWRPWFQIHPQTRFAPTSRITAIARRSDHLDLFITGSDGAVWSSWWHADAEGWRPWFQIHPETVFDQSHPVAAVARHSEHLDLFKIGFNGAVWSAWWSPL